tara:strand:+ start:548 stop:1219 length:672 start_codon:yes stop_codon:yes gene_type:complete
MKYNNKYCTFVFWVLILIFLSGASQKSAYDEDLILKNRSDSGIKYLTPPLSLIVVHNKPKEDGLYFFQDGNVQNLQQKPLANHQKILEPFLNNRSFVGKTLVKADVARLSPASQGKDLKGAVTRNVLKSLYVKQAADLVLVFRWVIGSAFGEQKAVKNQNEVSLTLKASGLIYITKQRKILKLPDVFQHSADLEKMTREILKNLAVEAKKTIKAQKKIITKSY